MKAVIFREPGSMVTEDIPIPLVGERDALVKVHACGVCGTDIHIFHGEHFVKFPVVPGHEFSGEVVEIGREAINVKIGDRVTIDPNIVDGTCRFCRRGEINLCENLLGVGVNYDGGYAEYCRVPAMQLYPLPDSLSLDEAAMTEPVACSIRGIDRAAIAPGSSVVILGAGSIGLILIQLARIAGAGTVIISDPDERKRHFSLALGADVVLDPVSQDIPEEVKKLTGVGPDLVIEAAGRVETTELAVKIVRRGGKILQFGVVSQTQLARISAYDIFFKELTILGSFVNPFTHSRAIELLALKRIKVAPLITHRFPLDQAEQAIQTAQSGEAVKVMLTAEG